MRLAAVLMSAILAVSACAPNTTAPSKPVLYVYRLDPPAFLELGEQWHPTREIPFSVPEGCGLAGVRAAPRGPHLAIELNCAFGPAVLLLNARTETVQQPVTSSDSHYLAWAPDGQAIYLKVDNINRPRIVRHNLGGELQAIHFDERTYDLAPAPVGDRLVYSLSEGMGRGSEMWSARNDGSAPVQIAADRGSYLALARWSPDAQQLAFVKVPDSATPFTVGEVWVMRADGSGAHRVANADAGHGFAPAWSPDGKRIAFVVRENTQDANADRDSEALVSNLQLADLASGETRRVTNLEGARVEAPIWKPDTDVLFFNARTNDRMAVYILDLIAGYVQSIPIRSICCAAWLRE